MGLWGYVRAHLRWVICLRWGLRRWTLWVTLFTTIGLFLPLGVVLWSRSGWGNVIRLVGRKVVDSVVESAGVETRWELVEEALRIYALLWGQLKGPLAELGLAAFKLAFRCVFYVSFYLVVCVLSLWCCVIGVALESTVSVLSEGFNVFCSNACHANWGEVACVLFC